jgi:predicted Ser/Thr protein kinase
MNLEELVEAELAGESPVVPDDLRAEFDRAVAADAALRLALQETVLLDGKAVDRPPPELPEDYEIVHELGRGGMGVVYLVRQKSLGRLVAVKVLRPGEQTFGPIVRRFLTEARHLARLRHPHIVSVHEVGDARGEPYFTMDYVEGEPLTAILGRGRLTPSRALAILKPVVEAVQHAHEQGIIHRDLKPGNILVDRAGRAFVTDFGLARDMTQASVLTGSGEVMGTPAYMAPEQARGLADQIGETTDVHALGVILYEMLTGRPPYGSDAPANILVRLLCDEPSPPRRIDRRIPKDLETICLKAMAKEPGRRYATVGALGEDLRRFESGEPPNARRPSLTYRAWRLTRRHWRLGVTAAVVAAMAIGLTMLLRRPVIVDRTAASLIAEARRQHVAGNPALAVRFYTAALDGSAADQRNQALREIRRCVDEIGAPQAALEAALPVLEKAPDVHFGKLDYLVAKALTSRTTNIRYKTEFSPTGGMAREVPDAAGRAILELARARLDICLADPARDPAELNDARKLRGIVEGKLRADWPVGTPFKDKPVLPEGTAEELHRRSEDLKLNRWDRGKAAFAEGKALESARSPDDALAAYHRAYELIRSVFPFYPGPDPQAPQPSNAVAPLRDPEEYLLYDIVAAIRRLDGAWPNPLRGGLRFRLEGIDLPREIAIGLQPILVDPAVLPEETNNLTSRWGYLLQKKVEVKGGGGKTAWAGVADGRYAWRILVTGKSLMGGTENKHYRLYSLLETDIPAVPAEIEVRGSVVEVPPIQVRVLAEIKRLAPVEGAAVDLREAFFRWSEVTGAASYRMQVTVVRPLPLPGEISKATYGPLESKTNSLCLGAIVDQNWQIKTLGSLLVTGTTGEWEVDAVDSSGRRIGASVGPSRQFLVARGLGAIAGVK